MHTFFHCLVYFVDYLVFVQFVRVKFGVIVKIKIVFFGQLTDVKIVETCRLGYFFA